MKQISIVVPTLNEKENIKPLIERLDKALKKAKIAYEIIFIDDHSTDGTFEEIYKFTKFPVRVFSKEGRRGKAYSLLEGFAKAQYKLIGMIDADLQYPPEAIPDMVDIVYRGEADIVVANRRGYYAALIRRLVGRTFHLLFCRLLHGCPYDVQAGLKVFNKEIVERISLNPTEWSFDLEFLIKAQNAGYKISHVDIDFSKRYAGQSKLGIIKASYSIGFSAIKLRFAPTEVIPFHPGQVEREGRGFHYKGHKFVTHTTLDSSNTAMQRVSRPQKFLFLITPGFFATVSLFNWRAALVFLVSSLTILYFSDLIFSLYLIIKSFSKPPEIQVTKKDIKNYKGDWPTYTVLCPLYRETSILPQFVMAMSQLDYPKEKLEVLLLLEQDDKKTILKAKSLPLPKFFRIIVIPNSVPKTKPKACNYGLVRATGDYAVIYDAEDIPDKDQLKKAVIAFEKAEDNVICIQAKLNYYNPHQNLLTRLFTLEYSLWFDLILTGLQSIQAPIPLGGTSNHFKTADLHALEGWDPFNVTEDADLGMRIVKRGYRTAIMDSNTMEEANSQLGNWFRQRSRWIKGYIQTYLVHMRNPSEFFHGVKRSHVLTFQLIVGGKVLSMLINPIMWIMTILYFAFRSTVGPFIESLYLTPVFYMAAFSLVFGNFLYMYYYMIGVYKRGYGELVKYAFLVPFYWLMMSVAAGIALYELVARPYHWNKTLHGLHLEKPKDHIGAELLISPA